MGLPHYYPGPPAGRVTVKKTSRHPAPRLSKVGLDELVREAIVDCYDESEQLSGLFTMIEEDLKLPFDTQVLGVAVTVEQIELTNTGEIVVVCKRCRYRQRISVVELPLPSPPPEGVEWIEAYRHWARLVR